MCGNLPVKIKQNHLLNDHIIGKEIDGSQEKSVLPYLLDLMEKHDEMHVEKVVAR